MGSCCVWQLLLNYFKYMYCNCCSRPVACATDSKKANSKTADKNRGYLKRKEEDGIISEYMSFVDRHVTEILHANRGRRFKKPKGEDDKDGDSYYNPVVEAKDEFQTSRRVLTPDEVTIKLPYYVPKFNCTRCYNAIITSEKELKYHERCHVSEDVGSPFRCCFCKEVKPEEMTKQKSTWTYIKKHLTHAHGIDFGLPCKYCDMSFLTQKSRKDHVLEKHLARCKYYEFGCDYMSKDYVEIKLHERCHNPDDLINYHCPECGYAHADASNYYPLRHHIGVSHAYLFKYR